MPGDQQQLESAWQALSERERRGEEAQRQRASELEARRARVSALWEALAERSDAVTAREGALADREHATQDARAEVERRALAVAVAEPRAEAGHPQSLDPHS